MTNDLVNFVIHLNIDHNGPCHHLKVSCPNKCGVEYSDNYNAMRDHLSLCKSKGYDSLITHFKEMKRITNEVSDLPKDEVNITDFEYDLSFDPNHVVHK
jgi:hypothetical protein